MHFPCTSWYGSELRMKQPKKMRMWVQNCILSTVFLRETNYKWGKKGEWSKKKKKMEESELNNFQILRIHVQEGACSSNASSSWSVLERLFISHLASAWQLDMVQGVPSRRTSFISLSLFIHMPENGIMGRSNWPHCYYQFDYFSKDSSYSCALFSKPFPKPLMT